jgi:transposase
MQRAELMGKLIMSKKERDQLRIFENLANGEIKQSVAAQMLNISARWVREKLKRYKKSGDSGLLHLGRGKPSSKKWCKEEQDITIQLLEREWKGFGPTFVSEKLNELKGIKASKETVRQMMIAKSFWIPGKRKAKHRKMRERRPMRGMLIQLDGSPHDWFEGRASKCTLIVFIDDATSEILWLEFVKSESFSGVAGATKNYVEKCGRPTSFYVDYGSVFSVNLNNPERCKKTQFERIMKEMNIDVIHARSPQAKGRVERCNKTMQDRLVKEMRLAGISSIKDANRFVRQGDFIKRHNLKFAVPPIQEGNVHKDIEGYNLYKLWLLTS